MKYSSLFRVLACGVLVIAGTTFVSAQSTATPSNYTPGASADDTKVQHMINNDAPSSSGFINAGGAVATPAKTAPNALNSSNGVNPSAANRVAPSASRLEKLQAARQHAIENGLPTERYDAAIEELTNQN